MFGLHNIGKKINTTAGKLTVAGDPLIGGEGAGYKARLADGRTVFYKEFNHAAAADLDADQTLRHRWKRTRWLVQARLDQLDSRINAPFAISCDQSAPPGYVCVWIDGLTTLEEWRGNAVPYADRLNVVGQLAYLLTLLHARGVAQGDVNAANVGITGTGDGLEVHLYDLGNFNNGDSKLRPLMVGEAEHMAYWLRLGKAIPDIQSDCYAFGVIAHEMLLARPVTAGCANVEQMLARLEKGRLPGDPMLGTPQGADLGLPYQILPPSLQTLLRNMLAPESAFVPRIDAFFARFQQELPNLIACGGCGMPYWWTAQRVACPSCSAPSPAAITVKLPSGGMLAIRRNTVLGRESLGGAPYLSAEHLLIQPVAFGTAAAYIRGRNGMKLIRSAGPRLFLPQGSGPVAVVPGDRLELDGTRLEFAE